MTTTATTTTNKKPAAACAGGGVRRRYALLLALWDSEYVTEAYGGYSNVFLAAFGNNNNNSDERWDCFRVIAGEFPPPESLSSYDAFVVSGSPHDAHADDLPSWVRRLCSLVQTAHAMRKRVLGVCFGHQILCRALGGSVGRARTGGWDVGVRHVTFTPDFLEFLGDFAVGDEEEEEIQARRRGSAAAIVEVHQDEVWEVPPVGARVLAYSEKTRVEAFAVGELALGIQGHPEYTVDILHDIIDRLVKQKAIQRSVGEEARRTVVETGGPDRAFWTKLCKRFLRGGRKGGGGGGGYRMQIIASPAGRETAVAAAATAEVTSSCAVAVCFTSAAAMVQLARGN